MTLNTTYVKYFWSWRLNVKTISFVWMWRNRKLVFIYASRGTSIVRVNFEQREKRRAKTAPRIQKVKLSRVLIRLKLVWKQCNTMMIEIKCENVLCAWNRSENKNKKNEKKSVNAAAIVYKDDCLKAKKLNGKIEIEMYHEMNRRQKNKVAVLERSLASRRFVHLFAPLHRFVLRSIKSFLAGTVFRIDFELVWSWELNFVVCSRQRLIDQKINKIKIKIKNE